MPFVLTCLVFAFAGQVQATGELRVGSSSDTGPGSLREAVTLANQRAGHDTIVFESGLDRIVLASGPIEISESLTLRSTSGDQIIDGDQRSRIFAVTRPEANLVIEGLTLTGARTTRPGVFGSCDERWGQGAALCALGNVTVRDSRIIGNTSEGELAGGAGLFVRGSLEMSGSQLRDNLALGYMANGGGLFAHGESVIVDSLIDGNIASGRRAAGGGIYARDRLRLLRSRITGNLAWSFDEPGIGGPAAGDAVLESTILENNLSTASSEHMARQSLESGLSRLVAQTGTSPAHDIAFKLQADASPDRVPAAPADNGSFQACRPEPASPGITAIDFGPIEIGSTSSVWVLTLSNPGSLDISIESWKLFGTWPDDFQIVTDDCSGVTLGTDESCELRLTASPGGIDSRFGTIGIVTAGPNHRSVALRVIGLGADVSVDPEPLDFGPVRLGGSASASVTIESTGNQMLEVASIEPATAPFALSGGNCHTPPFSLDPGESCTLQYSFSPSLAGNAVQTIAIDSNAPLSSELSLVGTGVEPLVNPSTVELDFGQVEVGTASGGENLSIENSGSADLSLGNLSLIGDDAGDFQLSLDGCSGQILAPAESCTVDLLAMPTTTGPRQAELQIPSDAASSPDAVSLVASGIQAALSIAPDPLDFGPVRIDQTASGSVNISNSGTAVLQVTLVEVASGAFASVGGSCSLVPFSLEPGESCSLAYEFTPTVAGPASQSIAIDANVPTAAGFTLSGTGVEPLLNPSTVELDFGQVEVGTASGGENLSIENSGSAELLLGSLTLSGSAASDFQLEADGCSGQTLAPDASCTIMLSVTPSAIGKRQAWLDIPSDTASSPDTVSLSVTGVRAALTVSPPEVDFGEVAPGSTSSIVDITLHNSGSADLALETIELIGPHADEFELAAAACSGQTLAPQQSCVLQLAVTPADTGIREARLRIPSNAADNPQEIPLTVASERYSLSLSSNHIDLGVLSAGESGSDLITVSNTGSGILVLSGLGQPAAPFSILGGSCLPLASALEPKETCSIEIGFGPADVPGVYRGRLELMSNATSSPDTIDLSGILVDAVPVPYLDRPGLVLLILLIFVLAGQSMQRGCITTLPSRRR